MKPLGAGQRITLFRIDDMMALTHRYEFTVVEVLEGFGYQQGLRRLATVKQRGKRKAVYLDLKPEDILLDGWDVPFKTDTECSDVFSGNACYNLIGDAATIRAYIEEHAIEASDGAKAKILVSAAPCTKCSDEGVKLLYPGIDTHHAVVNRFKGE